MPLSTRSARRLRQNLPLYLPLLFVVSSCGVFCPRCPEPPKPLPPPPPKIVEVVKPCTVPDPVIPFQPQDMPNPDASGQVILLPEAVVKLAQSILSWRNYVRDTKAKCGGALRVPR